MKRYIYFAIVFFVGVTFLSSCQKWIDSPDDLPGTVVSGSGPTLTVSSSNLTPVVADSSKSVVSLNWTDPVFGVDSTLDKYVIQIAPKGTNFLNPLTYTVMTARTFSVPTKDLNNWLIYWGSNFGTATDLEMRVLASFANNNNLQVSNVVPVKATAYTVPFTLSASATGPFLPTPQTKDNILTKLTWTAPSYETSTVSYILQYAKAGTSFASPTTIDIAADSLQKSLTAMNLYQMANATGIPLGTTGSVEVRIKATVGGTGQVSYSSVQTLRVSPVEMTLYLYVAGAFQSAAPYAKYLPSGNNWGWDPASAPKLASTDGINYEGYIYVPADGGADFKIVKGNDWSFGDYGGSSGETITVDGKNYTGGHLNSGSNLSWPAVGKYYLVRVNLNDKTWYAFETNWGLIGAATPGGWDNSTPMVYDITLGQFGKWKATTTFTAGEFKFRANNGWDINLGIDGTNPPYLKYNGDNITATAGTKTVMLDLSNPPKYTYTIQ